MMRYEGLSIYTVNKGGAGRKPCKRPVNMLGHWPLLEVHPRKEWVSVGGLDRRKKSHRGES